MVACWAHADILPAWQDVERELLPHNVTKGPVANLWTNSPTLRTWAATRNTAALVELAGQSKRLALGSISAFFALRKIDPELAQEVGLNLALTTSLETNFLVGFVTEQLSNDIPNPACKAALSRAFRLGPVDAVNVARLVQDLPLAALSDWFEDDNRGPCLPTCEAAVVDRLYKETIRARAQPTKKMMAALTSYASIPGPPRLVFLQYADTNDPRYETAFKSVLEDDTIPYLLMSGLILSRPAYIKDHFDLSKLAVKEPRLKLMTNDLAQGLAILSRQK